MKKTKVSCASIVRSYFDGHAGEYIDVNTLHRDLGIDKGLLGRMIYRLYKQKYIEKVDRGIYCRKKKNNEKQQERNIEPKISYLLHLHQAINSLINELEILPNVKDRLNLLIDEMVKGLKEQNKEM